MVSRQEVGWPVLAVFGESEAGSFLSKWVAEEATLYKVNSPSISPEPPGHAQALDVDTGA